MSIMYWSQLVMKSVSDAFMSTCDCRGVGDDFTVVLIVLYPARAPKFKLEKVTVAMHWDWKAAEHRAQAVVVLCFNCDVHNAPAAAGSEGKAMGINDRRIGTALDT